MPIDLGAVWEEHTRSEFEQRDVSGALRTMTEAPSVTHMPVLTGGIGLAEVAKFYRDHFIGQTPDDFELVPLSRTVGASSLVDEFVCKFTHSIVMEWMLPDVAATGRRVELPVVAIVIFKEGRIAHERVYWDQASLLVQIGLLDRSGLPVVGAEAATRLSDSGVGEHAGDK